MAQFSNGNEGMCFSDGDCSMYKMMEGEVNVG